MSQVNKAILAQANLKLAGGAMAMGTQRSSALRKLCTSSQGAIHRFSVDVLFCMPTYAAAGPCVNLLPE